MSVNIGIVGLPNAGKSTIFNALTSSQVPAENFPFCTIDPSTGVVALPDRRLDKIVEIHRPKKTVPTHVEFVDIAGLVKNASQGEGLGNQFLSHIRQTDAIAQVVRCFDDDNIIHVHGKVDPKEDIEVVQTELMLADLDSVAKKISRQEKLVKTGDKMIVLQVDVLKRLNQHLESGKMARHFSRNDKEDPFIRELNLLTDKPLLYIANVGDEMENGHVATLRKIATSEKSEVVVLSGKMESELAQLESAERAEFLKEMGLEEPGLDRLAHSGYRLLNLITYFTAGEKEARAWTIRKGTKAPQAAGVIHSDFEKGFIRAEIYAFNDLVACGSEAAVKAAGKYRSEGKEYVMQDGDIVLFRFNV